MRKSLVPAMAAGLTLGLAGASQAQVTTFAQFQQSGGGQRFTLNSPGPTAASSTLNQIGAFDAVKFQFIDLVNNPLLLNQDINAKLVLSASGSPFPNLGGRNSAGTLIQDFYHITFQFLANGAQIINGVPVANNANLLTGTSGFIVGGFNIGGTLSGPNNGTSATFGGSDVAIGNPNFFNTVDFTSSFITFQNTDMDAYAFSFSSITPSLLLQGAPPFQFIRSFTSAGTGTFSASAVPEPGVVSLLIGMGFTGGLLRRRLRRRA